MRCYIACPEKELFTGLVEMVIAVGKDGNLGITRGHSPLLAMLKPGPVRVRQQHAEDEDVFYISGGYIEVQPDEVRILADTALRARDVDEAAAKEAVKTAQQTLQEQHSEFDYTNATLQLSEAIAQLRTVEQVRKQAHKK